MIMMRRTMFRWPCFTLAFLVSGFFCLSSPGRAGLLPSHSSTGDSDGFSRLELEKNLVISSLEILGRSREEIQNKLSLLSDQEIHRLACSLENVTAGGEESEGKKAVGVGLVLLITLGLITGFYLFYQTNK